MEEQSMYEWIDLERERKEQQWEVMMDPLNDVPASQSEAATVEPAGNTALKKKKGKTSKSKPEPQLPFIIYHRNKGRS
ncbi:hypothetical protein Tco_0634899 [Tanacetum coccineum]